MDVTYESSKSVVLLLHNGSTLARFIHLYPFETNFIRLVCGVLASTSITLSKG